MGYMYAKYFLSGSFFAKHLFKSTASTNTGKFFFFLNLHRSSCVKFDNIAVATQLLNVYFKVMNPAPSNPADNTDRRDFKHFYFLPNARPVMEVKVSRHGPELCPVLFLSS